MTNGWKFLISVSLALLTASQHPYCAYSADLPAYLLQPRTAKPVELQKRTLTLEEMVVRAPYPASSMQPIPLHGVRVTGLEPKSVDTLGFNYFIVVDNTKYDRMSDIYKDSRLTGKSNFVTTDSIIHPYLAFTNRVLADVALKQIKPDMLALLTSMQQVSLDDYDNADDAEVRDDIARNVAYLSVAIKLLRPDYELPKIGDSAAMAEADLKALTAGRPAQSAIFNKREDYSWFKPLGWFNTNTELQNFYRCKQWLSHIPYPIDDVSSGEEGHSTNSFRRSVLLFRSLDDAKVLGRPAMEVWARLLKTFTLLGTPVDNWQERTLYPTDYKLVFADRPANLKVTLAALAEPLYRTKLMLAIRRQKPLNLSATSIFELDEGLGDGGSMASFRLFPIVCQPETRWFHGIARMYPTDKSESGTWPVGLLDMYAWGSPQAGNILNELMWTLDPNIAKVLPDLQHCVLKKLGAGQTQPVESRSWSLLSAYFKPAPEGTPGALKSDLWGSRKLVSAMGGWVDALASIAPPSASPEMQNAANPTSGEAAPAATVAAAPKTGATSAESAAAEAATAVSEDSDQGAATPRKRSKIPPYHFLEPTVEIYRQLLSDAKKMETELTAAHYLSEEQRQRFADFTRLFQRLQKIAETEMRGTPITVLDRRLLANIDQILDRIDVPLPSVISFESVPGDRNSAHQKESASSASRVAPLQINQTPGNKQGAQTQRAQAAAKTASSNVAIPNHFKNPLVKDPKAGVYNGGASVQEADEPARGFNMAVGRPGILYVIYQNPQSMEWTLGRGAVYTYYEMPAPMLTESMWKHKIDAGFAKPLNWTGRYEIVQQQPTERITHTAAVAKPH